MNLELSKVEVTPLILDLGAGSYGTSSYHGVIRGAHPEQIVSLDLFAKLGPDVLGDAEVALPFRQGVFNTCLALNLFEHLYDFGAATREIYRVLGARGTLLLAIPFLVRVHGDPNDYFRYTAEGIRRFLKDAGFSDIHVAPCGAGAFTAALAQIDFLVPRALRRVSLQVAVILDRIVSRRSRGRFRNQDDYPLGYVVRAAKGGDKDHWKVSRGAETAAINPSIRASKL